MKKTTKAPITKRAAEALPELSTIVTALGQTRQRLEDLARSYERRSLADRLFIGVCCLAAQDRHAMDPSEKGKLGGRGKKLVTRDMVSDPSPNQPHPQGFAGWLGVASPWLNRATAYKYMDAAKGAGLTPYATLDQVRDWTTELLGRDPETSLKSLVDAGRKLLPPGTGDGGGAPDYVQLTWDAIFELRDHRSAILSKRDQMSPTQYKRACAEAYKTLRDLTDQPWGPADKEFEDYIAVLNDANRVD